MAKFLYTTPTAGQDGSFADINESLDARTNRLQRALERDAAIKANQQRTNATLLSNAQKQAASALKRTDGYDSAKLLPEVRPLFAEYVRQQKESVNYFMSGDLAAQEQVIKNIEDFFVTYSRHTQDPTVQATREEMRDLATSPEKREDHAAAISPIYQLNLDLDDFIKAETRHLTGFYQPGSLRLGENGVVYGVSTSEDEQGEMPITDMGAWRGKDGTYDTSPYLGTKATKTSLEIATSWVRENSMVNGVHDMSKAREYAANLLKLNPSELGLQARMTLVAEAFGSDMLDNKDLITEYLANERDTEGNFVGLTSKSYQQAIFEEESKMIEFLAQKSFKPEEEEEDTEGNAVTQEEKDRILDGVFDSTPASFKVVSGDSEVMYGATEALRRQGATPFGEHYSLNRLGTGRIPITVENPAYKPTLNAAGEPVYPDVPATIEITPSQIVVVPSSDGQYALIIDKISVDGTPFTQLVLDSEQDQDTLKSLDFAIKENYEYLLDLNQLVEHAQGKFDGYKEAERAGNAGQGAPPAQTGRPDTSRY